MSGEGESNIPQQLLDITKQMLNSGCSFSLKLSIPNLMFSLSSTKEETPTSAVKKMKYDSPSQKKRNLIRKKAIFRKKWMFQKLKTLLRKLGFVRIQ